MNAAMKRLPSNKKPERRFAGARGSATLRELANTFRRMGDDANHVRLTHLNDPKMCEPWAARADAFYQCMRHVHLLLSPPSATRRQKTQPKEKNERSREKRSQHAGGVFAA